MVEFPQITQLYVDELRSHVSAMRGMKLTDKDLLETCTGGRSFLQSAGVAGVNLVVTEIAWKQSRRPFFNIHPPILRGLSNTRLTIRPKEIPVSVIHSLRRICIKFPCKRVSPRLDGISHFFINIASVTIHPRDGSTSSTPVVCFSYQTDTKVVSCSCPWDRTFEDAATDAVDCGWETPDEEGQRTFIARIGLGVMLLATDPSFIEPVLLKRDVGRSGDPESLAKRARQRGLIGYDIGRNMESSPHYRRPHFAIRWTGKGSAIPRLVPVKGSIIHKRMLTIPTGYEDDR